MVGMNGIELLEAVQSIRPTARVILMTAYGSESLEDEARRLHAHDFLHKPLEINAFRRIVQESLADVAINRPGLLILSDNRYRQLSKALEKLQGDVGARCTFLVDASGQLIVRTGDIQDFPIEAIASLLGGGIATLTEAGRALDGDEDAVNLAYREGKGVNLYAVNIGRQLLMILIIEQNPYSSKLGSVWYYAQHVAKELVQMLGKDDPADAANVLGQETISEFDSEFDKLLGTDEPPAGKHTATPPAKPTPQPLRAAQPTAQQPGNTPAPVSASAAKPTPVREVKPQLFSYEEAIKRGLIAADVTQSRQPGAEN
jgi:hypothetical protein